MTTNERAAGFSPRGPRLPRSATLRLRGPRSTRAAGFSPRGISSAARPAFTLAEVIVSLAVTTVLMGALGSAVYISGFAVPTKTGAISRVSDAAVALESIAVDLQYAQVLLERTAQAVTVIVADRNNDGAAERIRYSWSGVPGAPVMRTKNAGAATAVIPTAQQFQLTYATANRTEQVDAVADEDTTEVLLYEYAPTSGLFESQMSGSNWVGQSFAPVLPGKATHWKPTRFVMGVRRGVVGAIQWDLFKSDTAGRPTGASLANASTLLLTSLLPVTFNVAAPPTIRADQKGVLVGRATLGNVWVSCSDQGSGMIKSTNAGGSWTEYGDGITAAVYGKIVWPRSKITLDQTYAKAVHVSLTTGGQTLAQRLSVPTLNCPELLSQIWQVDFERDPTDTDSNADATDDFRPADNSPLTISPVNNGTMVPPEDLVTDPAVSFANPARMEVRMKSGSLAGASTRFAVNLERTTTAAAPLVTYLTTQSDGSATLRLFNDASLYTKQIGAIVTSEAPAGLLTAGTVYPLITVSNLPREMTDVRLVTQPVGDRVALFVDQVHQGTFTYQVYTLASPAGRALVGGDAGAEFDSVSIRME